MSPSCHIHTRAQLLQAEPAVWSELLREDPCGECGGERGQDEVGRHSGCGVRRPPFSHGFLTAASKVLTHQFFIIIEVCKSRGAAVAVCENRAVDFIKYNGY